MLKFLVIIVLLPVDVILGLAIWYTSQGHHAHQAHGPTLAAYVVGGTASAALWFWILRRKPAKTRPGYPYGGSR